MGLLDQIRKRLDEKAAERQRRELERLKLEKEKQARISKTSEEKRGLRSDIVEEEMRRLRREAELLEKERQLARMRQKVAELKRAQRPAFGGWGQTLGTLGGIGQQMLGPMSASAPAAKKLPRAQPPSLVGIGLEPPRKPVIGFSAPRGPVISLFPEEKRRRR